MKRLKKSLAFLLALCMIMTCSGITTLASEVETAPEATTATEIQSADEEVVLEEPSKEATTQAQESSTIVEEESKTTTIEADAEENEEEMDILEESEDAPMLLSDDDGIATLADQPSKPADGTVSGYPFVKGTAGSNSFRIPAMVTLSDGTLVAAADARWNTTFDGGCGDTIVARSSDNGANWKYTFANYLGDNGNSYNGSSSTCFIDPALAVTSDDTIYMLVDLYPYGIALNGSGNTAPSTAVGFNNDGTLKLSADGSNYNYYLKDGKIYNSSNTAVSGYTVDGYFNVYQNGTYVSNLFFSDSPYKVVRTGYLYLTKSTDKGATWSEPTLINNIKTSSEQVCLVGPGRGTVLSDGTIIFPVYSYNGSTESQKVGFIYSTDGVNWSRSNSNISWSSESAVVELNSSTLRVFYRNGNSKICYVDVTKNGNSYTWGSAVTTSVSCNSNTQLSAIKVTESGTDYILVSNPGNASNSSSGSARTNGQIVTFKASDMSVMKTTSVASVHSSNSFMYSCMSQLSNSDVAILYEDQESNWGTGSNSYYQMSFKTFTLSDLGIEATPAGSDTITDEATNVTVKTADGSYLTAITSSVAKVSSIDNDYVAYDVTLNGGAFTGKATVTIPLSDKLKSAKSITGFVVEKGSATQISGTKSSDGNYYSFETPHFSVVGVMSLDEPEYSETVTLTVGQISSTYTVSSNTNYGSANATTTDGIASYVQTGVAGQAASDTYTSTSVSMDALGATSTSYTRTNYYYKVSNNYYPIYVKYYNNYKVRYDYGYSTTDSASNVTSVSTKQWSSNTVSAYTKSTTPAVQAKTTIQFTGVTSGTTYVTSGTTTYKVVVSAKTSTDSVSTKVDSTETLNPTVSNGDSVSYEVTSGTDVVSVSADGTVKGLKVGSATIVATVKASNGKAVEIITYDVTVAEKSYEQDVTIAIDEDKSISVNLERGQYVEWSSSDANTAAVVGTTADTAVLLGSKAGTAVVKGTVKDASGNVVATYIWNVTVTDSNTKSKYIYVNVSKIEHTTVYYSVNGGELIKVNGTGVILDEVVTGHYQLAFYAAPDEGYALTYMASTNSAGEYYCLSDGEYDGVNGSAWPFADGYDWETKGISTTGSDSTVYNTKNGFRWGLAEGNISIAQLRNVYARAIALGCDGTLVFTKNNAGTTYDYSSNGNNLHSDLTFVSQPLPKMTKTIKTVGGNAYQAGTTKVKLGDEIVYTITVTRPATNASYGTITYSNEELKDPMTDGDTNLMPSGTMGTSTTSDKTYSYETKITLNLDNYDDIVQNGTITNTANFTFAYKSQYSNGKLSSSANASADQIVIDAPTYVIDFGLPFSFDIDKNLFGNNVSPSDIKITSTYGGNVLIEDGDEDDKYTVTYEPEKVLEGIDTLKFTVEGSTKSYIVMVYPATTVDYEPSDPFVSYNGTWNDNMDIEGSDAKAVDSQTTAELGNDPNVYGYDAAYNVTGFAKYVQSETLGNTATFDFTGTGVDIYNICTDKTGIMMIRIYDNTDKKTAQLAVVDTVKKDGSEDNQKYGVITNANGTITYSKTNLSDKPHSYKVTLYHTETKSAKASVRTDGIKFDGFRVYNTLADSSVYEADDEDNPNFYEVRDLVLGSVYTAIPSDSAYADQVAAQVYTNIKDAAQTANAVVLDNSIAVGTVDKDMLDNGFKNEIYLRKGQTLVVGLGTTREVQVGMHAVEGSVTCSVNGTANTIKANNDMFYTAKAKGNTGTLTITNNGDNVLSISKIKVCDDANAIAPLTEKNIADALRTLGYKDEEKVEYADASLAISLVDYTGASKASKTLTANGIVGEEATFSASDIEAAVNSVLPAGYAIAGDIKDATLAYGEDGTLKVQIGKVATLKITYKKGKNVVGTATLTHVQTSKTNNTTFSTSEIKAGAPAGYRVISLLGTSVKFGSSKSINATCY